MSRSCCGSIGLTRRLLAQHRIVEARNRDDRHRFTLASREVREVQAIERTKPDVHNERVRRLSQQRGATFLKTSVPFGPEFPSRDQLGHHLE
jgi:hypothetical protein